MPISIYDQRALIAAVRNMPPARTFLSNLLYGPGRTFTEKYVEVQYRKGTRKLAPFVSPLLPGKVVERDGYKSEIYEPALIKPMRAITAIDLETRGFGTDPYAMDTPEDRARELLAQDMVDLDNMIVRREEWMRATLLFTGKVVQIGDGVADELDFGFTNKVILSGANLWSDDTSDPLAYLEDVVLNLAKGGYTADAVILAADVAKRFIRHPKVKALSDKNAINLTRVDPSNVPQGAVYIGSLAFPAVDLYSYNEWYLDDATGTEMSMVPAGTIAVVSTQAKFRMHYGAVTIMDKNTEQFVTVRGERVPQSWATVEPAQRFLQISSKPIPVPESIDSWYVAKVL